MNDDAETAVATDVTKILSYGLDTGRDTPFRRFVSDYFDSKIASAAAVVLGMIIFIAIFAPFISPQNPYDLAQVSILDSKFCDLPNLSVVNKSVVGMLLAINERVDNEIVSVCKSTLTT